MAVIIEAGARPSRRVAGLEQRAFYPTPDGTAPGRAGGSSRRAGAGGRRARAGRLVGLGLALALAAAAAPGCATNPVTGRRSFNAFSFDQDVQLGEEAYKEYLASANVVRSGAQRDMVQRVMQRIADAAESYYEDAAPPFQWEVELVDEPETVNAFALPGGKMVVFTGILPVTQTEDGLAVVMGHEVGHALARHGTERMTTHLGVETARELLLGDDWAETATLVKDLALTLPHSRAQETDADRTGLLLMARAGYDPREAVPFWTRMSQLGGEKPPEMMSTHPSDETRIGTLEEMMPEALQEWQASTGASLP